MLMACATTAIAQNSQTYVVQRGETIVSIAKKYGLSEAELRQANPDLEDFFFVGMKLNIPKAHSHSTTESDNNNSNESQKALTDNEKDPNNTKLTANQSLYDGSTLENSESLANTWHLAYRMGASFYKIETNGSFTSGGRTYENKTGFEVDLLGHYYITENLFLSFGLGYYETASSSSIAAFGYNNRSEIKSRNVIAPIEIGLNIPIVKDKIAIIAETGPSFAYALGGYYKNGSEKKSFSEMEDDYDVDIERFGSFYRISAGLNIYNFRLMYFYGIPLSKKSVNVYKDKNFWGISMGWEF